jgi:hypothetical protein
MRTTKLQNKRDAGKALTKSANKMLNGPIVQQHLALAVLRGLKLTSAAVVCTKFGES